MGASQVYYPSLTVVLSFLLVFRINMSYQRYWEGRTAVQVMVSKLADIALHVKAFVLSDDAEATAWKDRMGTPPALLAANCDDGIVVRYARRGAERSAHRTNAVAVLGIGHRVVAWRA
jgi:hypothetical protein